MDFLKPNQTSARMLIQFAQKKFGVQREGDNEDSAKQFDRYVLCYDIFIKARSYYILNKILFFVALLFGFAVLLWPSLAIIAKDVGWTGEFWKNAVVQTTITAIAGLTFSIYSQYKKKQMFAENLLRFVIWSDETFATIRDTVVQEMARIDTGFNFSRNVLKKQTPEDKEKKTAD